MEGDTRPGRSEHQRQLFRAWRTLIACNAGDFTLAKEAREGVAAADVFRVADSEKSGSGDGRAREGFGKGVSAADKASGEETILPAIIPPTAAVVLRPTWHESFALQRTGCV